jgi:hypothetical protein
MCSNDLKDIEEMINSVYFPRDRGKKGLSLFT